MPAQTTATLTLEQYHAEYAGESGYEYWFGEVIRKPMPSWLHAVLQALLGDVFYRLGYFSGSELTLRVDPHWEPCPDVAAALELAEPYPTRPVDIVAEILSPDDTMAFVFKKCRQYVRIGIPQIFVFDPETRDAWEWSRKPDNLERITGLLLGNGASLDINEIWAELDQRLRRT
ncbi:MAG TPA: Uma2 family endonuclease [Bryobacteraceae bacterium]|nr:Uma2 family endonuclease [Bryobacteraceae bacterium]